MYPPQHIEFFVRNIEEPSKIRFYERKGLRLPSSSGVPPDEAEVCLGQVVVLLNDARCLGSGMVAIGELAHAFTRIPALCESLRELSV